MSEDFSDFGMSVPAWRARRLRDHLRAQFDAGKAAAKSGVTRQPPEDLVHRAEIRRWLAGWDAVGPIGEKSQAPTPRQLAKVEKWRSGAGRLRPADGARRSAIIDAVADEHLVVRPLPHGAIAQAHRETVRRCREAGLPAPKASRYRRWLKLSRGI